MACHFPIWGWPSAKQTAAGKRKIVFDPDQKMLGSRQQPIPCGQCIGCRLDKTREWAMRCTHEAELWDENCFVTLTYEEDKLPLDGSLDERDVQLFLKRLRKKYCYEKSYAKSKRGRLIQFKKIRHYIAGEYGPRTGRPHYHGILFNHTWSDGELLYNTNGQNTYTSKELDDTWQKGFCTFSDVSYETAAYCAGYTIAKSTGKWEDDYEGLDLETGEIFRQKAPYAQMSREPPIGMAWYKKFKSDCWPKDFITINGKEMKPPKIYLEDLEREDADLAKQIKLKRLKRALENPITSLNREAKEKRLKQANTFGGKL
jgi:hypothetical protein